MYVLKNVLTGALKEPVRYDSLVQIKGEGIMELSELFPRAHRIKADLESRGAEVFIEAVSEPSEKIDYLIKAIWPSGRIWEIQAIEGC